MSSVELPRSWEDVSRLVRRNGALPAHYEELDVLRTANEKAVFREFTGNTPPLLPGIVQTPEYTRALFTKLGGSYDPEHIARVIAMRRGLFSLILEKRTSVELVMSEQALDPKTVGLCEEDMYYAMDRTLEVARHQQVDLRVLGGALDTQSRLSFSMFYTDGSAGERGHGFMTGIGEPSSLPVRESGMHTLELVWAEVQAAALSTQESFDCIERAMDNYGRAVAP